MADVPVYLGCTILDPQAQIATYTQQLLAHHDVHVTVLPAVVVQLGQVGPFKFFDGITLHCTTPTDFDRGSGLSRQGDAQEWQFKLMVAGHDGRPASAKKPASYRMGFLMDPGFGDQEMTVSHLCHHNFCHTQAHLVLEPLAVNKSRNGCPGGHFCQHQVKCLRPGPFYNA